jgi:membrane protein YqaA with SNARE-associated domain
MSELLAQIQAQTAGDPLRLCAVTFLVCFVSGLVPLVHSEAYLVSVSALSPLGVILPLTLSAALGQMTAKVVLYFGGRGVVRLPLGRHRQKVAAAQARFEKRKGSTGVFLFVSAFTGLPPFLAVSVLAGMLRLALRDFVVAGLLGRFLRFGVATLLPQIVRHWV